MFMHMFLTNRTWKTGLARRLAPILDGARHFMAECASRPTQAALEWKSRAQVTEILMLAYKRLGLALTRLDRLFARWQAGTLRASTPRAPRPAKPRETPAAPQPRLPTAQAWIYRLAQPASGNCLQFQHAMATDAEFAAFIAAVPQAGRILRPLCRMLSIQVPAALQRPKPPRQPRPRQPRPGKPAAEPAPPPIDPDIHYRFSQVPAKWRLKGPLLQRARRKISPV